MARIIRSATDDPVYNLAYEAYLTETVKVNDPVIFLWQNNHTIVVGRHQNPWKECLVNKFIGDGGIVIRRLSGGGAVYHDHGNLNFSIIHHEDDYDVDQNIIAIKYALLKIGFDVTYSGKNDLTINGKKFSGHAFFKNGEGRCHHGAVLVDTKLSTLSHYLTPSKIKIQSKSIDSVRARVMNLSDVDSTITVDKICQSIAMQFSKSSDPIINTIDKEIIKQISPNWVNHFNKWEWTYAESPEFEVTLEERFDWGSIEVGLKIEQKKIKSAKIYSDSNESDKLVDLLNAIENCSFDNISINEVIDSIFIKDSIGQDIKELFSKLIHKNSPHQ